MTKKGTPTQSPNITTFHLDPKNQDIATFVDEGGNRQSMPWFLPRSKPMSSSAASNCDFLCRHFKGGIFTRPPAGMNVVMFTQGGRSEAVVGQFALYGGEQRDLSAQASSVSGKKSRPTTWRSPPCSLDVQFDRGRDDAMAGDANAEDR